VDRYRSFLGRSIRLRLAVGFVRTEKLAPILDKRNHNNNDGTCKADEEQDRDGADQENCEGVHAGSMVRKWSAGAKGRIRDS
jgi:hypothetical protein